MDFGITEDQAVFLSNVQAFLDVEFPEKGGVPFGADAPGYSPSGSYFDDAYLDWLRYEHQFERRTKQAGFRGADWPADCGGGGRSSMEQWLLLEELAYRHLPTGGPSVRAVGRALIRHGSDKQRRELLPKILSGEVEFALGYTEPEAGSDLAALRTRARRVDAGYVINGQKLFITGAQRATHLWLAARTGPQDRGSGGVSLFVIPMGTAGIVVQDIPVQAGEKVNAVFLDDVEVPESARVGAENAGWSVIRTAVSFERMQTHADLLRMVERLADWVAGITPLIRAEDAAWAHRAVAELYADIELGRLLAMRAVVLGAGGDAPVVEAAEAKVWLTDLRQRVASTGLDIVCRFRRWQSEEDDRIEDMFQDAYLYAPVRRFAGGTNEVLRTVIARHGLRMPRN